MPVTKSGSPPPASEADTAAQGAPVQVGPRVRSPSDVLAAGTKSDNRPSSDASSGAAAHPGPSGPPPAPRRAKPQEVAAADAAARAGLARQETPPAEDEEPLAEDMTVPRIRMDDLPQMAELLQTEGTHGRSPSVAPPPPVVLPAIPPPPQAITLPPARRAQSIPETEHQSLRTRWNGYLRQASRWGDAAKEQLPPSVRAKLERVPGAALVGGGAVVSVLIAVGFAWATTSLYRAARSSEEPVAATSSPPVVLPSRTAVDMPPAATVTPAARPAASSPSDEPADLLELGEKVLAERREIDLIPILERFVARFPERKSDERLSRLLLAAAASDDRRTSAGAHALMTGPLGESGARLVYELSLRTEVRDAVRVRAKKWLSSSEFERGAPLPVYAAVLLRDAKSCEDKHALLDFAGKAGGKYVLEYLQELDRKRSCAPQNLDDCYPCMQNDARLANTIEKLQRQKR